MPTYRTMKQGILKEGQKSGIGMGGCGRVEILRCVKGLKPGMAEWYIKFVDFKVENTHQSDLLVYITKRRTVKRRQRYVETRDFRVLLDVGSGGRCKGPGARGTFVQPLFNVPIERDITGVFVAKPRTVRPITSDTQIHLWCQLQNKSDRDPAEWYPILHEQRKKLEDMFFERATSTTKLKLSGGDGRKKLEWLRVNAQKAFDQFDEDGSGAVDYGEYIRMLRYLQLFLLPCDSRRIFQNCDMDDTSELDRDQFEVALYVIITVQEYQRQAAEAAAAAMQRPGTEESSFSSQVDGSAPDHPTMRLQPHEAFESFDNDRDGLLDQLEFNEGLRSLGVVPAAPRDPLSQEEDLRRLMDKLLDEVQDEINTKQDAEDPTRLVTFVS